jgi:hypothetical protein
MTKSDSLIEEMCLYIIHIHIYMCVCMYIYDIMITIYVYIFLHTDTVVLMNIISQDLYV